jgi:hypothetical protein
MLSRCSILIAAFGASAAAIAPALAVPSARPGGPASRFSSPLTPHGARPARCSDPFWAISRLHSLPGFRSFSLP